MAKQNAVVILDTNNRKLNFFFMNHCSCSQTAVRYKNGLLCDGSIKPKKESERKIYHEIKYMKSQHKKYHYRMQEEL